MNTKTLLCIAIAFFCSITHSMGQSATLIAHWPFDGNANDATGNGHNGTALNVAYNTGINGVPSTAAVFNGSSSYISVLHNADLDMNKYTICAVVKPTAFYTALCQKGIILERGIYTVAGNYSLALYDNAYDSTCTVNGDTSHFVFSGSSGTSLYTFKGWQYTPATITNQWYTVVLVFDSLSAKMYVNGQLMTTNYPLPPTAIGTSSEGLYIGASYKATTGGFPYWFTGSIDDLRLYKGAMSASDVANYSRSFYMVQPVLYNLCKTVPFNIDYRTTVEFPASNVFSIQLSDNTGSFASPTTIGSTTSGTGGTITCTVPSSVPLGTGYKMRLVSSSPVRVADTVSAEVFLPAPQPTLTITVAPSINVNTGLTAFFTAIPTGIGSSPKYQWQKNSVDIPGATNLTYSAVAGSDFVTGDSINLIIHSSVICATPDSVLSNGLKMGVLNVGVDGIENVNALYAYPNPSKGSFTLKGKTTDNSDVQMQVVNMMGQTVYTEAIPVRNNELNKQITLNNISNGIYYVHLHTNSGKQVLKIAIQQ